MFTLFETPVWFAGFDLALDTVAFLIALVISSYSFKLFRLSSNRKFGYFSLAFGLMSIGLLFKLATYAVIYSSTSQFVAATTIEVVTGMNGVDLSMRNLLYRFGFFVQMAATLGSLLLLYLVSQKSRDRLKQFYEISQISLFTYFVLFVSVVATFKFFVFYLTSMILLALIVLNYYQNYLQKRSTNSWRVLVAFSCLLCAQLFFVLIMASSWSYFVAEILTIISFGIIAKVYMEVNAIQKKTPSTQGGQQ